MLLGSSDLCAGFPAACFYRHWKSKGFGHSWQEMFDPIPVFSLSSYFLEQFRDIREGIKFPYLFACNLLCVFLFLPFDIYR